MFLVVQIWRGILRVFLHILLVLNLLFEVHVALGQVASVGDDLLSRPGNNLPPLITLISVGLKQVFVWLEWWQV